MKENGENPPRGGEYGRKKLAEREAELDALRREYGSVCHASSVSGPGFGYYALTDASGVPVEGAGENSFGSFEEAERAAKALGYGCAYDDFALAQYII